MNKSTNPNKDSLPELILTVMMCVAVMFMAYAFNKRLEILECRVQVQTARIDVLNGLEITRPPCLDELLGPLNKREAEKKPVKRT